MNRFLACAMVLAPLCGCGRQPSNIKGGAQTAAPAETPQALPTETPQASTPQASPANAYAVPDAPTPTISDADRPKTIDEFRSEFVRLYQKDMYAPFIELAYWGSSTDEQKREYLSYISAFLTINSARPPALIESAAQLEATPIEKYGEDEDTEYRYSYYPRQGEEARVVNPEPTHVLRIRAYLKPAKPKGGDADASEPDAAGFGDEPNGGDEDERGFTEAEFAVGVHDGKYYFCTIKHD